MEYEIKIKPVHQDFKAPKQASNGAAGFDFHMPESGTIPADGSAVVGTGMAVEIPPWHVGIVAPRSGMGFKFGVELYNTIGVIDHDFRGEIMLKLSVKNGQEISWEAGDRLVQMLVLPLPKMSVRIVDELGDTERGQGGLGSTGK